MVHWLDTRHWNRVMLTQCDMVTHVCTKLSGNWSNIYIWRKCIRKWVIKNALLACLDARASAGTVMTTKEFHYGICYDIGLLLMKCYNQPKINALLTVGDWIITIKFYIKKEKKRKHSEFMHVVLLYRQAIAWNACDFGFGLDLKCVKETFTDLKIKRPENKSNVIRQYTRVSLSRRW